MSRKLINDVPYKNYVLWSKRFAYKSTIENPNVRNAEYRGVITHIGTRDCTCGKDQYGGIWIDYKIPNEDIYQKRSSLYWIAYHIYNISHEYSHANDYTGAVINDYSTVGKFRALTYFVTENNRHIYSSIQSNPEDPNYGYNLNEIYAEHYAAERTRELLLQALGNDAEKTIKATILEMMNDRIKLDGKHSPMYNRRNEDLLHHSWEDIETTFEDAKEEAENKCFSIDGAQGDICYEEMKRPENKCYFDSLKAETKPMEYMRKLACFTYMGLCRYMDDNGKEANACKNQFPCLDDMDLTYAKFDKDYFTIVKRVQDMVSSMRNSSEDYLNTDVDTDLILPRPEDEEGLLGLV